MKFRSILKTGLLIITLWPLVYIFFFANTVVDISFRDGKVNSTFITAHIFTLLLTVALIVFYIVALYQNNRIKGNSKMLWTISLLMLNVIAMPCYWWIYIKPSTNAK